MDNLSDETQRGNDDSLVPQRLDCTPNRGLPCNPPLQFLSFGNAQTTLPTLRVQKVARPVCQSCFGRGVQGSHVRWWHHGRRSPEV
jgi:hypothetical protein